MKDTQEDGTLLDLVSNNPDLHDKIAVILDKMETSGITEIEEQISVLLKNMMNFFSKHAEEIPSFDSLTPQQKEGLSLKFKEIADNLSGHKLKTMEELLQVLLFTVLSTIGQTIEEAKYYTKEELLQKKQKKELRDLLRRASAYELYQNENNQKISDITKEHIFINNAILRGVKEAMEYSGVKQTDLNEKNKNTMNVIEKAHLSFKNFTKSRIK